MKNATRIRLRELNRVFYREAATEFSASRQRPWAGWDRVVDVWRGRTQTTANRRPTVLDLGCGNARFAAFLVQRKIAFDYVGVDLDGELLAEARRQLNSFADGFLGRYLLLRADIAGRALAPFLTGDFDLVTAFGVFHHIPGVDERRRFVESIAQKLTRSGLAALALWRFESSSRFSRLNVPWTSTAVPDDVSRLALDVEPGDHLLGWRQRPGLLRFCHSAREEELSELRALASLEPIECFDADGPSERENHYLLYQRAQGQRGFS